MTKKVTVHGHEITYEDNAAEGIRYLTQDLSREEAEVFFNQAKLSPTHSAPFEDDMDRDYTLVRNEGGGYTLIRRS